MLILITTTNTTFWVVLGRLDFDFTQNEGVKYPEEKKKYLIQKSTLQRF